MPDLILLLRFINLQYFSIVQKLIMLEPHFSSTVRKRFTSALYMLLSRCGGEASVNLVKPTFEVLAPLRNMVWILLL